MTLLYIEYLIFNTQLGLLCGKKKRHYFPLLVAAGCDLDSSTLDSESTTPSEVKELFHRLSEESQLEILGALYSYVALASGNVAVPDEVVHQGYVALETKWQS